MSNPAPVNPKAATDDRATTAPVPSDYGWPGDFLSQVPFEAINRNVLTLACRAVRLAIRSDKAVAQVLLSLPREREGGYDEEEKALIARMEAGDETVLSDAPLFFFDQQEIAAPLAQLYGYGRSGEGPGRSPEESLKAIEALLAHHRALISVIPASLRAEMGTAFTWLADTLAAAEARWATDHGRGVTPEGLAAFAGVKLKTVANQVASKALPQDADGLIPAAAALAWLSTRKDFVPSWWQTWRDEPPAPGGGEALLSGEQVFVPVDGEGSPFLPSLARRSRSGVLRYAIGEKANPEYVEDYWEALAWLARMPAPRWRRPNPDGQGGWGLVTAQEGWRRFARADLERMVFATQAGEG